jgi:hypothetical protein
MLTTARSLESTSATNWISERSGSTRERNYSEYHKNQTSQFLHDLPLSAREMHAYEMLLSGEFERVVQIHTDNCSAMELALIGCALLNLARLPAAIKILKASIVMNAFAHGLLAATYIAMANAKRSDKLLGKARTVLEDGKAGIASAPSWLKAFYWREIGQLYARSDPEAARNALLNAREAAQMSPLGQKLMSSISVVLSGVYDTLGLPGHALGHAREGLRFWPNPTRRQELLYRKLLAQSDQGALERGHETFSDLSGATGYAAAYARGYYMRARGVPGADQEFSCVLGCGELEFEFYARLQLAQLRARADLDVARDHLEIARAMLNQFDIREHYAFSIAECRIAIDAGIPSAVLFAARAQRLAGSVGNSRGVMMACILEAECHLMLEHRPKAEIALERAFAAGRHSGFGGVGAALFECPRIAELIQELSKKRDSIWGWAHDRFERHNQVTLELNDTQVGSRGIRETNELLLKLQRHMFGTILTRILELPKPTLDQYGIAAIAASKLHRHGLAQEYIAASKNSRYSDLAALDVYKTQNELSRLRFVDSSAFEAGLVITAELEPEAIPIRIAVGTDWGLLAFARAEMEGDQLVVCCVDAFSEERRFVLSGISSVGFMAMVDTIVK